MVGEDGRSGKLANLNNIDAVQSTERCTNTAMLRMKLVTKCASVKPIYWDRAMHAALAHSGYSGTPCPRCWDGVPSLRCSCVTLKDS